MPMNVLGVKLEDYFAVLHDLFVFVVAITGGNQALFDEDPGVRPKLHVFVGSKAPWWEITDGLPQHDKWVPGFAAPSQE
jgi:hypothetical protein